MTSVDVEVVQKVPEVDLSLVQATCRRKSSTTEKSHLGNYKSDAGGYLCCDRPIDSCIATIWGVRTVAAQNLLGRSTLILPSADPQQISKLKTQLELQEQQWMSQQIHSEFLALSSYIYWRDFGGEQVFYDDAVSIVESIPQIHLGWVGKVTQALMLIDVGRFEEADGVLNQIDDSNHDLIKWAQLELGVHNGTDGVWNPEIMEYPRVLVTAIQQDAMVPIIDSENAWIQLVSLQQELGHISVNDATVVLDSLQDKHWELGAAQQSMLYLLKSLYQNQQQSPKSRLLRKAYDANSENPDVQFWLGLDYFWSNEPLRQ